MASSTDVYIKATQAAHRIEGIYEILDEFGRRIDKIDEALASHVRELDRIDDVIATMRRRIATGRWSQA